MAGNNHEQEVNGVRIPDWNENPNHEPVQIVYKKDHPVINAAGGAGIALAGVLVGTLLASNFGAPRTVDPKSADFSSPTPGATTEMATPTPSTAAGTPGPELTPAPNSGEFNLQNILGAIKGDSWSLNIGNWHLISDNGNPGAVMDVDKSGLNHVVSTLDNTVVQGYWDAILKGQEHQAISFVLAPGKSIVARGVTEWPVLPGQTAEQATDIAFQGQVDLEERTQPNVCTLEISDSIQALSENRQDLSNPPAWQPNTSYSLEDFAKAHGLDAYAQDGGNWRISDDGYGYTMNPDKSGANHPIKLGNSVAQVYWDARVDGEHQAIAGTLGTGTEAPVRGATLYSDVPQGMEQQVFDYAYRQAVNLEIDGLGNPEHAQPGVFVVKVEKTVCPTVTTSENTGTAPVKVQVTPEPTTVTMANPTVKPEATPRPTATPEPTLSPLAVFQAQEKQLENKFGTRAHPLKGFKNGFLIENGAPVRVSIYAGERIDTPQGSHKGPWTGEVTVATIWNLLIK